MKLKVNGQPQKLYHRPQAVKDHGELYDYFPAENETKNKYSPQEIDANEYDNSHEWRVQDEAQKKAASQSEEDNSDKPGQAYEDPNNPVPAPRFYFNTRFYLKGKH